MLNESKIDSSKYSILIVDDERLIRESLGELLRLEGYAVFIAASAEEAIDIIEKQEVSIVITDINLPKLSGLDLLEEIKRNSAMAEVIMITGHASVDTAVKAMRDGAYDYITKPINDSEIKLLIGRIVDLKASSVGESSSACARLGGTFKDYFGGMIGSSAKMQHVYHLIESVASSNATIHISGESGTGKGLVARAIHGADQRRHERPFVEISCGALSETLLESELFGHVKGAFTGAIKDKEGRFEYANGGTIFLDEIDAFSLNLQVKLLRVLQDSVFERVGDNVTRKADVRIIVATNQNLLDLVREGKFREDLYYRINVIAVAMPPLRERKEDIEAIVHHFIRKYNEINNKRITNISREVKKIFMEYTWPGNIRELENAIEGGTIMSKTDVINKWDIPDQVKFKSFTPLKDDDQMSLRKIVEQPEKEHILSVLKDCNWNRNKAALVLGVNRTTLYNKIKKYDIVKQ